MLTVTWSVTGFGYTDQEALVTVEKVDINAAALRWRVAATADVAGALFTIEVDE